jgi:hypothetical protein
MEIIKCHVCKNDAIVESTTGSFIYRCDICKRRFEKIPGVEGHAGWRDPDAKKARVKDESGTATA